jgi:hypothetical protein
MPHLLTLLPDDALIIVAKKVVRNGDAYWFAATCCTARRNVAAACLELGIAQPSSKLRTIFASLQRLRAGVRLDNAVQQLVADNSIPGAHALPASLDGRYTWTPAGRRALVMGATVDVMDYAWAGWRRPERDLNNMHSLEQVCLHNRADLMEVIYQGEGSEGEESICLKTVMRLAVRGHPDSIKRLMAATIEPAISGCAAAASDWLYEKLEGITQEMPNQQIVDYNWRRWLSNISMVHLAVRAAVRSDVPDRALTRLTDWWMPRFGSRAPSERLLALEHVTMWVLESVTTCAMHSTWTPDVAHKLWMWLRRAWPMGLAHLLRQIHEESTPLTNAAPRPTAQNIHRHCLRVRDVPTYRWMREQTTSQGWMHDAIVCRADVVTWTVNPELTDMRHAVEHGATYALAYHTWARLIDKIANTAHPQAKREIWEACGELVTESYSDMLLLRAEPSGNHASIFFSTSATAFARAVQGFHERASKERRVQVFAALMPAIVQSMIETGRDDDLATGSGADRDTAWSYINSLRTEYSKDNDDQNWFNGGG